MLILTQDDFSLHSEKLSARLTIWIGRDGKLPIESPILRVVLAVSFAQRSNRLRHWGHS
jgi:hypothetical protein